MMSLESVRKKLESEYGRIPNNLWKNLTAHCYYEEDAENDFLKSAREVLNIAKGLQDEGKSGVEKPLPKNKGRKPGWTGHYSPSFEKRYDLYCIDLCEESKRLTASLSGKDYVPPTLKELHEQYKDRTTLHGLKYVPKNLGAFEKAFQRAKEEFGSLTEEDMQDWRAQSLVNAFQDMSEGWCRPRTFSDGFEIVRDRRKGITGRGSELWSLIEHLVDALAPETQRVAEKESTQNEVQPEWILAEWTLNDDATFEDIMLAIGARDGWPNFQYRMRFTIGAGEESWREFLPQVPQEDRDEIVAAFAEERSLQTAYRERQAAQAKKAAQDDPQAAQ